MIARTQEQIDGLKRSGAILAETLQILKEKSIAGITTVELDRIGREFIESKKARPAFLNYTPRGANRPFPGSICISINDEIVHGIPNEPGREIQKGDVVSLDAGVVLDGFITDSALTVIVGGSENVDARIQTLVRATQEALNSGIKAVRSGGKTGDIGAAIQAVAQREKLGIFRELAGHGVGERVHEYPDVPNYGKKGRGERLEEGLVIAIEPMFSIGKEAIRILRDGYTYATKDGSIAAHFEHTVIVTKQGSIVVTKL